MPNPSQEPPTSSKSPDQDLKDMDVLCTFKIKIESQNLNHGCIKDQWPYPNHDLDAKPQSGTSASSQSSNQDLKYMDILCTLEIKIEPKFGTWACQRPVTISQIHDQDAKPQSGASSPLQSPKWGLRGHGFSSHLQNQDRESKFGSWGYKRQVNTSESWSRCQTPIRNHGPPQYGCYLHLQHLDREPKFGS